MSTFCVDLCIFVIGDRKVFKFDVGPEGWMCRSQPTNDKLSLIGAWSDHVTHFNFWVLQSYHWNGWS